MMALMNTHRNTTPPPRERALYKSCINLLGRLCSAMLCAPDRVRMIICHYKKLRLFSEEQSNLRKDDVDARMHDAQEPWTIRTAFHAISGTCVYRSRYATGKTMSTLDLETLRLLASSEPQQFLPVKIAAAQNPGQSSVIVKLATCVQAAWFCSQCIARMNSSMAISLLELNTFAHCVSAFFIYGFWWHKPYDVTSHTFVQSDTLDFLFLRRAVLKACWTWPSKWKNADDGLLLQVYNRAGDEVFVSNIDRNLRHERGPEAQDLQTTEGYLIPGTKFFFREASTGNRATFNLPEESLIHWERLWRFMNERPDYIPCVEHASYLRYGGRAENIRGGLIDILSSAIFPFGKFESLGSSLSTAASVNITFILYGGLHLLAWHYHFRSKAETILWKVAGVCTASSGAILLLLAMIAVFSSSDPCFEGRKGPFSGECAIIPGILCLYWIVINLAARTYLFVESFVALPNSPPSTYLIPKWTAYIPHI